MAAAGGEGRVHQISQGFARILLPFRKRREPVRHPHKLLNQTERLDLRASQRTFDGAYVRTALGQLTFALTVMRLFQKEFFWIGLANCVLAVGLFITAALRYRMTMQYEEKVNEMVDLRKAHNMRVEEAREAAAVARGAPHDAQQGAPPPDDTTADDHDYLLLPRFHTAGNVVAFSTLFILLVEIAITLLIVYL